METANIYGIEGDELDKNIYRIIPLAYLYPIFEKKENVLVRTGKWNDPFENFMLKCRFRIPTGEIARIGFRDHFFGQCWSTRSQSEALWRLYSATKESVRIRSTPRKLFGGLCKAFGDWARVTCFIGRVQYFSSKRLVRHAKSIFADIQIPRPHDFAKTLLFKRSAFKHEEEIRLLYLPKDEPDDDLYSYPIKALDVVDDIRLDPRLTPKEAEKLEEEIRSRTGFKGNIKKSDLYDPPPDIVLSMGIAMTSRAPTSKTTKRTVTKS
jgi:hypothetical protein